MPQASDEDRAKMKKYFGGDGIDDGPPMLYLDRKGWKFTRGGTIEAGARLQALRPRMGLRLFSLRQIGLWIRWLAERSADGCGIRKSGAGSCECHGGMRGI